MKLLRGKRGSNTKLPDFRGLIREVVSLEEDDLHVFNYLSMHLKSGLIRGVREAL